MAIEEDIHGGAISPINAGWSRLDRARLRGIAYAVGPAVIFLLVMTYLLDPEFYLKWVIEAHGREYQIVEVLTFAAAFSASILLTVWARCAYTSASRSDRIGIAAVAVIALAAFFFAGEEISWGQTHIGWGTPEGYRELAAETNLHNTFIPVHSLGSAFLVVVFFVLPLVWALGLRRPAGLRIAIAEGPVIFCVACAFLWRETKSFYRLLHEDYVQRATYIEFFEQINEHKELLIAVSLLLYAIFRFRHRFTT